MAAYTKFELVDIDMKVDTGLPPDPLKIHASASMQGKNVSGFFGQKAGVSAWATLGKLTAYVSNFFQFRVSGPSANACLSAKWGSANGYAAMLEASYAKAEVSLWQLFYVSGGYNANTGIKLSHEGFKAAYKGFGVTLGIGGKVTFDIPFGSAGFGSAAGGELVIPQTKKFEPPATQLLCYD